MQLIAIVGILGYFDEFMVMILGGSCVPQLPLAWVVIAGRMRPVCSPSKPTFLQIPQMVGQNVIYKSVSVHSSYSQIKKMISQTRLEFE